MADETEGFEYENTPLGHEFVELPIFDDGSYPNSPKPENGHEMSLRDAPGFINHQLSEAVKNGNFHRVVSHYVGVAKGSGIVDHHTLSQLEELSKEATANRFDDNATKVTFKKISEIITNLKMLRREKP